MQAFASCCVWHFFQETWIFVTDSSFYGFLLALGADVNEV